jgi:hypothetical protein
MVHKWGTGKAMACPTNNQPWFIPGAKSGRKHENDISEPKSEKVESKRRYDDRRKRVEGRDKNGGSS